MYNNHFRKVSDLQKNQNGKGFLGTLSLGFHITLGCGVFFGSSWYASLQTFLISDKHDNFEDHWTSAL